MMKCELLFWVCFMYNCARTNAQQPQNIVREAGETNVFIPCSGLVEFSIYSPFWQINGVQYTISNLPPGYSYSTAGIIIDTVHSSMDNTSFQCFVYSPNELRIIPSTIGYLTVPPKEDNNTVLLPEVRTESIELDHQRLDFNTDVFTLAWRTFTGGSCNASNTQIRVTPVCDTNHILLQNITAINTTEIILLTSSQETNGEPSQFNISTVTSEGRVCSGYLNSYSTLIEPVRFQVNTTTEVQVLFGSSNCECINTSSNFFFLALPSTPNDVLCPVYIDPKDSNNICYDFTKCNNHEFIRNRFDIPFFNICRYPTDNTILSMCFSGVAEDLDGFKMFVYDSFIACAGGRSSKLYTMAIELHIRPNVVLKFSAPNVLCIEPFSAECYTDDRLYNISLYDVTGNLVYANQSFDVENCVEIDALKYTECYPFNLKAVLQSMNNTVNYDYMNTIPGDDATSSICECLQRSVEISLELNSSTTQQPLEAPNELIIEYSCNSTYSNFLFELMAGSVVSKLSCADQNTTIQIQSCKEDYILNISVALTTGCQPYNSTIIQIRCSGSGPDFPLWTISIIIGILLLIFLIPVLIVIITICAPFRRRTESISAPI